MGKRVKYVWLIYPVYDEEVLRDIISGKNWKYLSALKVEWEGKPFCTELIIEVTEDEEDQLDETAALLARTGKLMDCHRI